MSVLISVFAAHAVLRVYRRQLLSSRILLSHNACEHFFWTRMWERAADEDDADARRECCRRWGWAVPNATAIQAVVDAVEAARCRTLLDFGCGRGFWSALVSDELQRRRCLSSPSGGEPRVVALDRNLQWYPSETHTPLVEGGLAEATPYLHSGDTFLLLVWPPWATSMAADCLRIFKGNVMAYCGEGRGGKTASQAFFELLLADWVLQRRVLIPTWQGCSDTFCIYRRKHT